MNEILRLMWQTGPVAKVVLVILFLLSMISWAIILEKIAAFSRMRKHSKRFLEKFADKGNWNELVKSAGEYTHSPHATCFLKGFQEFAWLKRHASDSNQQTKSLQQIVESEAAQSIIPLERLLPILSTTVSVSPFLGLFGTVWGVMSAFLSIGLEGNADISTVGPGIAEALITTVVGLFVAIPALAGYNLFVARLRKLEDELERFAIDFSRALQRGLHQ